MLRALGQPFEMVHVDYLNGKTREPEWREENNDMGEAPVLEDGALRLTQSGMILTYLADKHGKFGGKTDEEKREILRWILFDNHKFSGYFSIFRFFKSFMPTAQDPAVMAFLKSRVDNAYRVVEKQLGKHPYLIGDDPTIADFSLSGYVFYPLEESGYDVAALYPNIAAWRERIKQLPGWGDPYEVMPGKKIAPRW